MNLAETEMIAANPYESPRSFQLPPLFVQRAVLGWSLYGCAFVTALCAIVMGINCVLWFFREADLDIAPVVTLEFLLQTVVALAVSTGAALMGLRIRD